MREYPGSDEIYEVSLSRTTLTLLSVQGVPVGCPGQVVKPLRDTAESYLKNHADATQPKTHFGCLVDVIEADFTTRLEVMHTVDTGSPAYAQLRALAHECTYSAGTDLRTGILQNSIDTLAEFRELCRIIDPTLAKTEGGELPHQTQRPGRSQPTLISRVRLSAFMCWKRWTTISYVKGEKITATRQGLFSLV